MMQPDPKSCMSNVTLRAFKTEMSAEFNIGAILVSFPLKLGGICDNKYITNEIISGTSNKKTKR